MVASVPRQVAELAYELDALFLSEDAQGDRPLDGWRENPLPFPDFMREHMRLPLWPAQEEEVIKFLGVTVEDTKRLFSQDPPTPYNCGALVFGKGSGKDLLASAGLAWFIHVLLCMEHPQRFLQLEESEAIDIAIASPTLRQTRRITFAKLKNRLKGWDWLLARLHELGIKNPKRYLQRATEAADFIELPFNIKVHNLPLEASRVEGFNMLAFVLSEYAAMESEAYAERATEVFEAFASSGKTRYARAWKGFIASFPRSAADPQEQLIDACDNGEFPELFYVRRPTWEVHPRLTFDDFASDFARDPEGSWAKFGAQPRAAVDKYFRSPDLIVKNASGGDDENIFRKYAGLEGDRLHRAMNRIPDPVMERDANCDVMLSEFAFPLLWPWFRGRRGVTYQAHCDVGLSRDSAGFAIGHLEPVGDRMLPVLDLSFRWRAAHFTQFGAVKRYDWRGAGTYTETVLAAEIDLKTISDFVIWLNRARGFQFEVVSFDGFNSAQLKQEMLRFDIPAYIHNVDKSDFDELKGAIYQRQLQYRLGRILFHELYKLELRSGKVEAPRTKAGGDTQKTDSHKDEADAVAAVVGRLLKLCHDPYELPVDDAPIEETLPHEDTGGSTESLLETFLSGS